MGKGELVFGRRQCEPSELREVLTALEPPDGAWIWFRGLDAAKLTTFDHAPDDLGPYPEGLLFWDGGQVTWLAEPGVLWLSWLGDSEPAGAGWEVWKEPLLEEDWALQEHWMALANFDTLDFEALGPVQDGQVLAVRRRWQATEAGVVYERFIAVAARPLSDFQP